MGLAAGRIVLHRHFQRDKLAWVRVARVVSDDERGLLLWICPDSPAHSRRTVDNRGLRSMPFTEWITQPTRLAEGPWDGPGILSLLPPGAAHSVWWFWRRDGGFNGWYVNLEEPSVRWDDGSTAGVDMTDQDLDIAVAPDRSWKDEHELVERLDHPDHYWVADADAVWAEGERVVPLIEAGAFPFDGTWCDFTPDPLWTIPPQLPPGWDRPRARQL